MLSTAIDFFCVYPCCSCSYRKSSKELRVQEVPGTEGPPDPTGISGAMVASEKSALNEFHLHSARCAPPTGRVEELEGQDGICGSC